MEERLGLWKQACAHLICTLYGAVAPDAFVKPYRLDMLRPLRVDGKSLKAYWKAEWARVVRRRLTVVNCAGDEFSTLLETLALQLGGRRIYERKRRQVETTLYDVEKGRELLVGLRCANK